MRWLAALFLLVACSRGEAPAPTPPATTPVAAVPERAPDPQPNAAPTRPIAETARARCVEPTPAEAPPAAKKAAVCPADPGKPPELARGYVEFPEAPGAPRVPVELAKNDAERERGLMYRTSMPDDQGMLFSWDEESVHSFWMKNTCIPLDMLFIAKDGTIAGILEQVPTLNEASRSVRCPVAHVLELNAGWCRSHGVVAGQNVKFE